MLWVEKLQMNDMRKKKKDVWLIPPEYKSSACCIWMETVIAAIFIL